MQHTPSNPVAPLPRRVQNAFMQVVINGEPREIADGVTITALLTTLGIDLRRVAVELNEQVVPKARHAETSLAPNDRLEIVTFVGGG